MQKGYNVSANTAEMGKDLNCTAPTAQSVMGTLVTACELNPECVGFGGVWSGSAFQQACLKSSVGGVVTTVNSRGACLYARIGEGAASPHSPPALKAMPSLACPLM